MVECQERGIFLKAPPFGAAQIRALGYECKELEGLWVWLGPLALPQSHLQTRQSPRLDLGSGIPGGRFHAPQFTHSTEHLPRAHPAAS